MAITLGQQKQANSTNTLTVTAPGVGSVLLLLISSATVGNSYSVSGVAATWTQIGTIASGTTAELTAFVGTGSMSGTTITVTHTGTVGMECTEWTGFGGQATTTFASSSANAGTLQPPSATSPGGQGVLVDAVFANGNGNSLTLSTADGTTALTGWNIGTSPMGLASYALDASATAHQPTFSYNGGSHQMAAAAITLKAGALLDLTGDAIGSAEAFGAPSVSAGPVSLAPTAVGSSEAFGADQLNASLSVPGIASAEVFGAPNAGTPINPSAIASAEAFGTDSLGLGLALTGIPSAEAFGVPAFVAVPVGIPSAETFGTAKINQTLYGVGIASSEAFGTAVFGPGPVTVSPTGIASAQALGVAKILEVLGVTGIASAEAFGAAHLNLGPVTVSPTGLASAEAFGVTIIRGVLAVVGIPSAEAFGFPRIAIVTPPVYVVRAGYGVWYAGTDSDGTYRWGPLDTAFGFRQQADATAQAAAISSRSPGLVAAPIVFFLPGVFDENAPASYDELIDVGILVGP